MTTIDDAERALALSYSPAARRAALHALFALDVALGQVLRTTREPMVGQMRLAWWREALERLDHAPPPAEPVLRALATEVLPLGVTGADLARMVDGWEGLLGAINERAIQNHGLLRGGVLFEQGGRILEARGDPLSEAGRGWALADLAAHLTDPAFAARTRDLARPSLDRAGSIRWGRNGRALGALTHIARLRLEGPLTPRHIMRLAWHRLTGR